MEVGGRVVFWVDERDQDKIRWGVIFGVWDGGEMFQ